MKLYKCTIKISEACKIEEKRDNLNEEKTVTNMVRIKQFR